MADISMQRRDKHTSITVEELLRNAPRLYNEELSQLREELRESLETAVEDDWEEMARLHVCCS
jgi:hypothetical protein